MATAERVSPATVAPKRPSFDHSIQIAKKTYHKRNLVARLLPETDGLDQLELLRVVIQDKSSNLAQGDLKPCGHADLAAGIFQRARPAVLQAAQRHIRCDLCEANQDIWLCLTCLGMFCSRENEGHHGLKHFAETGHCVVMSLVSLNFWCYAHEQYLEHDFYPALVPLFNAVHEVKHGEPAHIADMNSSPRAFGYQSPEPQCLHAENSVSRSDPPASFSLDAGCKECGTLNERWVCLTCFETHCGRFANKHMIKHNQTHPGHDLCLSLKDLSIWCQRCQQYLDTFRHPCAIRMFSIFHRLKFKDETLPEPLMYQSLLESTQDMLTEDFDFPLENGSSSSLLPDPGLDTRQ